MIGKTIGKRYQIEAELGAGGMGTVYRALDTQTQTVVALKHLTSDYADAELIERFKREGEALRELNHPNIVKMLNALEDGGQHYLVMEYVTGGDLSDLLKQGQLSIERCLKLSLDLADALTRAHKLDIIHRDLKPANVLIADDSTLRLTDFGVARIGKKQRVTDTDAIVGTVDYLAPETLEGSEIDPRADIWAFGVMLFEMLAGERPFKGETVTQTLMHIMTQPTPDLEAKRFDAPIALVDLVYRMLEKSRDARIRSVRYVGAELEDILHGRTTHTPPETRFAPDTPNLMTRPKHNLPAQTTPFVGREHELREVAKLITNPKIRLMTILAPGGMGKTRLVLEAAEQQVSKFDDGVYFVELAPLSDPANIVLAIAEATGYQFQGDGREQKQQILDFLKNKNMLLVLDNFEHLLDGAGLVTDILKAASDVQILVTSRQRLSQSGETLFHLSGMDFPDWETPEDALEYAAVKLFMNSAQRAQPSFELTEDNLDYVARICRLVQGMPLGIVLAASWLAMLSPEEIADEIQQSIDFLTNEAGEVPNRQRSIRAVFDYSWEQMTQAEQDVFMKLSVFRGGFTRDAAQEIAEATLRILMSLLNKSLLRRDADTGRYEIHELLRQYIAEKLVSNGIEDIVLRQHQNYYISLLKGHEAKIKGQGQTEALYEIKIDFENICIAWINSTEHTEYHALEQAIETLALAAEMNHQLQRVLELFSITVESMASNLNQATQAAWQTIYLNYTRVKGLVTKEIDVPQIESILQQARQNNNMKQVAFALWVLGDHAAIKQDYGRYLAYYEEAIAILRDTDNSYYLGHALLGIYEALLQHNQPERMLQYLYESVQIRRQIGDKHGLCFSLYTLAGVSIIIAHVAESEQYVDEALTLQKELKSTSILAHLNGLKSFLIALKGDFESATVYAEIASRFSQSQNYLGEKSFSLTVKGFIETLNENYEQGFKLCLQAKETAFLLIFEIQAEWGLALANSGLGKDALVQQFLRHIFSNQHMILLNMLSIPIASIQLVRSNSLSFATKILGFYFILPKSITKWTEQWQLFKDIHNQLKSELGEEAYNAAWKQGKSLDLETVVKELVDEFEAEK